MKYILLAFVVIMMIVSIGLTVKVISAFTVQSDEDKLCREYARRDHEKEIAPERYAKLGKEFFDDFDWYTSCVNHTRYPVAR